MLRDLGESEQAKGALEYGGIGGGKFDELESVESHRVVEEIGHGGILGLDIALVFDIMRAI